ncbi:MAG: response regulator transcription factor [Bacteroidia bacterium]|nr:response regulator transcription factor [Bacteroidia bacterium]
MQIFSPKDFTILLIDSDEDQLNTTELILKQEGFQVISVKQSKEAIVIAKSEKPNLILLELVMPELDGIDICIELRKLEELNDTLIVFYTLRDEDYSQIAAFNAGADDYIVKPAKPRVLITRLKALLKRQSHHTILEAPVSQKGLVIDRERYLIFKDGQEIVLPRKEFELLSMMYNYPRRVFTRKEISEQIWGYEIFSQNRTIDVHIRKLREKLGDRYIKTIKGIGYSLEL